MLLSKNPKEACRELHTEPLQGHLFHNAIVFNAPYELLNAMADTVPHDPESRNLFALASNNSRNRIALHYAVHSRSSLDIVKLIVGAYPQALFQKCLDYDNELRTPLMMAQKHEASDDIKQFLSKSQKAAEKRGYAKPPLVTCDEESMGESMSTFGSVASFSSY
jgi:hypothetical protein